MSDPRLSFMTSVSQSDEAQLLTRLEQTRIEIVAGADAAATLAGQALMFQLATLVARLFDRVALLGDAEAQADHRFPFFTGPFLAGLQSVLPSLRAQPPADAEVTVPERAVGTPSVVRVLVGSPGADAPPPYDLYVGATAWGARVSVAEPQPVTGHETTLGALAAGALGAGELFKLVFHDVLRGAIALQRTGRPGYTLSLLTYEELGGNEPDMPDRVPLDATLFGSGSLGCGLLLGIALTPQLAGTLVVVDNGRFDERNPYKYSLLDQRAAVDKAPKAVWAQRLMSQLTAARITTRAFSGTAYEYVASLPHDYRLRLGISAVDTNEARFEIQEALPMRIVNAGVDGTVAEVSVHGFGDGPCLACLGMQRALESWDVGPIVAKTGLLAERVRELIRSNGGMTEGDIQRIKAAALAPAALLAEAATFVGQPVLSFYNRALYSETTVTTASGTQARVTTAFVSAFGGILLLAESIKESAASLQPFRAANSYRQDLLGIPAGGMYKHERDTTGWCSCSSSFRQLTYREKYGVQVAARSS